MKDQEKYFNTCPCCCSEHGFPTVRAANENWRVIQGDLHLKARQTARRFKRLQRAALSALNALEGQKAADDGYTIHTKAIAKLKTALHAA